MQKWCPEPFAEIRDDVLPAGNSLLSFESETSTAVPPFEGPVVENPRFEKDFALTDRNSLWDLMNDAEKAQLLDKTRGMLQAELESREDEIHLRHQTELAEERSKSAERLDNWSREFSDGLVLERQEVAVEAAGLAIALAGKIIRDTVEVDPDFLTRTLETALFKVRDANPLTVTLHPDDVDLLTDNPDLLARLRIETVVPDRRVEKGGCRIRAGVREWDATLSHQMNTLAEIVEECLSDKGVLASPSSGENDDPGLD